MSYEYQAIKNKHPKQPKVHFEQYLYNTSEPPYGISIDMPPELEAELLESRFTEKRRFRRIAQRLRKRYL